MRRRENVNSASADAAVLPRIARATRLSLRALIRNPRRLAKASLSSSRRSAAGLLISGSPRLFVARVTVEGSRRGELAKLVADHVLGHQDRDEFMPIVDAERQPDELREDRRAARPRPDYLVTPGSPRVLRLLQQITIDEGALPNRSGQAVSPCSKRALAFMAPADDQPIRRLVVTRL